MTRTLSFRQLLMAGVRVIVLLAAPLAAAATAQQRPQPTVELTAGWVGFADDGIVNEGLAGGAARFYLLPCVSVGPEIAVIRGDNHSHLMLTGSVTWDVLSPVNGRPRRVTPFLVAGGGLFQTRETFFAESYTSTEGSFTAGGGVRAFLSDRVFAGIDMRIGWEPHVRVTGLVGVQLGRR